MSRSFLLFALLGAYVCVAAHAAGAAEAKTALVQEAVVTGKSVYLSDLLPKSCPPSLRVAAGKVLVGAAPEPGGVLVLSSAKVSELVSDKSLRNQLDVPEQVAVYRWGHQVTREEVAAAIKRAWTHDPSLPAASIAPASVRLAAPVLIRADDAGLRVIRMRADPALRLITVWLVSNAEPARAPFMAMVSLPGESGLKLDSQHPQDAPGAAPDLGPALVEPGQSVRLHLVSGSMTQMYLTAISLERGDLNQTVHVKIHGTGKVVSAQVVGQARLEAQL